MKKNKAIIILFLFAGLFLLNSCLKDTADYWKDDVAGKMYATVLTPTLQTLSLKPVAGNVTYSFLINIATDALPTEDITITLKKDSNAVLAYNAVKKAADPKFTPYKSFPYSNITINTPTIKIDKGTRTATATVTVFGAETLNACDNFIAAVTIASATTANGTIPIAANMKSCLTALPISNPYAGDYQCIGYRVHPVNGMYTVDQVETATTVNCKTIKKKWMGDYPYDVTIEITTATIVVGGVTCYKVNCITYDPATGAVVAGGMATSFTGDKTHVPIPVTDDINYYDPVAKKFVLNYYYNTAAPRMTYEVLTRIP